MPTGRKTWELGPFRGCWSNWRQPPPDDSFLYYAVNMVIEDPVNGAAVRRRISDQRSLVSAAAATIQFLGVLERPAGTLSVGIAGGEIYTYAATTATWTRVVTAAQLTAAGITLSTTAQCYCCNYVGTLVVNDGINQPFVWNGTAGAGLTALTNAPSKCYGRPTSYYAKLFFIKDVAAASADRMTIVWSEENAANTGYEAGGFNNAWTLGQSGSGPLYALEGTNEGLYYWRRTSIGVIRGAVTPTFSTDGQHDGISRTYGTTAPRGTAQYGQHIYFADQTGRPWRVVPGGPLEPLWRAAADWFEEVSGMITVTGPVLTPAAVGLIEVTPIPFYDAVGFAYTASGGLGLYSALVFSGLNGNFMGAWDYRGLLSVDTTGQLWDELNNVALFAAGGNAAAGRSTIVTPPNAKANYWQAVSGTDTSSWNITLPPLGRSESEAITWRFDELIALVTRPAITGGGGTVNLDLRLFLNAWSPAIDTTLLNTISASPDKRVRWGINRTGRWAAFILEYSSNSGFGADWGVSQISVSAYPTPGNSP